MTHQLSPILQAAKDILKGAGLKGMYVRDIAEAAVAQHKNMNLSVEDFHKKVQTAIAANLKLKSAKPTFAPVNWDKGPRKGKPRQGWYRLRPDRSTPAVKAVSAPQVSNAFLGKAGEHAVMSELLFWGFNSSIMTVDDGIDIVSSKDSKFFHIQVKTATRQDNGSYSFSIKQDAFRRYDAANVFYVFVMRETLKNEYIVVPSSHIKFLMGIGAITDSTNLSVTITADAKRTRYALNGTDITPCYGGFGQI